MTTSPVTGMLRRLLVAFSGATLLAVVPAPVAGSAAAAVDVTATAVADGGALAAVDDDNDPPETTITGGPGLSSNNPFPTFTFASSEPGSTFRCRVVPGPDEACTSPYTAPRLEDGRYVFIVQATDASGNFDPLPADLVFFIDTVAPVTEIMSGPTGVTSDATPTFQFDSNEGGTTWECRLDEAAFEPCPTPYTTAELADGPHTIHLRAVDMAGNVDQTPESRTFTVDTVGPDTSITGGPEGLTSDDTPTFTFISPEAGVTFQCSIGGDFLPCVSPHTTDDLGTGDMTFRVRAVDPAGNPDATPASRSFTIDQSAPVTSITSVPDPISSDRTPTFAFTSSDPGASFQCRVDTADFAACTSPHTTAALDDGRHRFEVRSIDAQGNVEQGPAAHAFTIDTVAPDTTIASGPTGPIRDDTPTFGWDSATDVDFECRVDDAPFAPCASPKTTATLSDGEHTFDLRAVDTAGNADPTPDRRVFTVDTAEPETTITGGPEGPTADATPTFTFTSSEPGGTFQCLVGVSFEPCTSPYTYAALEDGSTSFQVRAVDAAGNLDESPAIRSFFVDTFPPDTTITSGPTGTITDETATFTFGATQPGATFECRVDGAPFVGCTSPHTTAALADGDHTFQVRATDPVGNADPTPASRTFTVDLDTTGPNTWIDSGPSDPTTQVNPTFTFSADEPASFECKIDTGSYAPCEPGGSFGPLADGSHTFSVRATDLAGNVDPSPASRTWTVDTTPPQTTILSGPTLLSLSRRATFDFASSEAGSTFQCRLDGDAWQLCTNPRTYTGVVLGRHTFEVRATDRAGNTDATAAEKTWTTLGLLPF